MPRVIFTERFKHAADGINVKTYEPSETPVEVSERCAEVAIAAGVAKRPRGRPPESSKDRGPSPENRMVPRAPQNR